MPQWHPPKSQAWDQMQAQRIGPTQERHSEPWFRRLRAGRLLIAILAVALLVALIVHVASSSGISVKISPGLPVVRISGAACVREGTKVHASGTLAGTGGASAVGISVTVLNSSGQQIGAAETPPLIFSGIQSKQLNLTLGVHGTAALCQLTWGAGPPPGLTTS